MKYEDINQSELYDRDLPVVGGDHEYDQFDLASWMLGWLDRNWPNHPTIKSWKINREPMQCGHPAVTLHVVFDFDRNDRDLSLDVSVWEKQLDLEATDYIEENHGMYGVKETVRTKSKGLHVISDTIHHTHISFSSYSGIAKGAQKFLEEAADSGADVDDIIKNLEGTLPPGIELQAPKKNSITRLLEDDEDE